MYFPHPVVKEITNRNLKIWRYMDLPKFVSMLENQALFFAKASLMSDLLEGQYPISEKYSPFYRAVFNQLSELVHSMSDRVCLNYWHINKYESAAMWKLYSNTNEGIAIQSTFGGLANSFKVTREVVVIGKVKYIDYQNELINPESLMENVFAPFFHKRRSFEYEHELRAVIFHRAAIENEPLDERIPSELIPNLRKDTLTDSGMFISTDLKCLIEKIYISPLAEVGLKEKVEAILEKYQLDKTTVQTSLLNGTIK
jgi:hypothetical protein